MDQKQKNCLIVLAVVALLIFSLGLLIGLYERNYSAWTPPMGTYGQNTTRNMAFLLQKFTVPKGAPTSYCRQFNIAPVLFKKAQGIQFSPIVDNSAVVDHIFLWGCTQEIPRQSEQFECPAIPDSCNSLIYSWGPTGDALTYPDDVAYPFDPSSSSNRYLLQIRYSYKPEIVDTQTDGSGVFVGIASASRQYDAGVFRVGALDSKISIPANQSSFEVVGRCDSNVTSQIFASSSVQVFGSSLFAHQKANQLWLDQLRNGGKVGEIGRSDSYTLNSQRVLPVQTELKAGDALQLHCVYNTASSSSVTTGGSSLADQEQCVAYLSYYPALASPSSCLDNERSTASK